MVDTINSSTIKSGNVLALLNTLYTSGFAMSSPNQPMLKGRTMHTLYALSFIVYVTNCFCDWIHVYCTLRGAVTSFPLETWLVITMVATVVGGTMLTGLLLVLCVENAFAHRLDVTPYRSGFAVIIEAIVEWIQAFNNFRVVFLVMILHDTPMTIINFFFLASCRCANPTVFPWSLLISSFSTSASLGWRLVMLYFGYRRMICPVRTGQPTRGVATWPTPSQHLRQQINTSNGARLNEFDECWPVRLSRLKIYGEDEPIREIIDKEITEQKIVKENSLEYSDEKRPPKRRKSISEKISMRAAKVLRFSTILSKAVICGVFSFLLYALFVLFLCLPCFYHYTCRKNSFHHRHKFARSFVRYMSYTYHYSIITYSFVSTIILLLMNIILMSSVHVVGSNELPPEVSQVCIYLDERNKIIDVSLSPNPLFSNMNTSFVCKPIWENHGLGLGLHRHKAGPWQTRKMLATNKLLAVSTQVVVNNANRQSPYLTLLHDHAVLELLGPDLYRCTRGKESEWEFIPNETELPWPYFRGCTQAWFYKTERLIDCEQMYRKTSTLLSTIPLPTTPITIRKRIQKVTARRHRHEKVSKPSPKVF